MGACTGAEAGKTIRPVVRPAQKAVIKDTKTEVKSETIAPRVSHNVQDGGSTLTVRVRLHPHHELEMNENVEEPWTCQGDQETDGCQSDSPQFLPGMGTRYTCHQCIY